MTTAAYLLALCLIAAITITSHVLTDRIVARQERTALLVNTAGRQRMLSQRIARVAEEVADGTLAPAEGNAELLGLSSRMETAQQQLLYGDIPLGLPAATSPELRAVYFGSPIHLQQQVAGFLKHARLFEGKPTQTLADPDLRAMVAAAREPLLNGLDAAVATYQAASERDVQHLQRLMSTLTSVMLLVLVLEALLVYRPLFKRLTRSISMLMRAATTDFLTGVMNRRAFIESSNRELGRASRQSQALCILIADIDRFKQINDVHGHAAGDVVLQHFASIAELNLRAGDFLGRIGGEEFALLLPATDLHGGLMAADRLRMRFAGTTAVVGARSERVSATVSIGVACATSGTVDELMARADAMLYQAKRAGRNRVEGVAGVTGPEMLHGDPSDAAVAINPA